MRRTATERFWKKVDRKGPNECWLWTGYLDRAGYAPFYHDHQHDYAHRFSFIIHHGQIPDNKEVDHKCRVRNCVNPAHLRPLTHQDNVLAGNTTPAKHAAQTHCKRGHPFDASNTIINNQGQRQCRICNRLRSQMPAREIDLIKS